MTRMATVDQMREFWNRCLSKLDQQDIPLETESAKKAAIQVVQRVLNSYLDDENGVKTIIAIITYQKKD